MGLWFLVLFSCFLTFWIWREGWLGCRIFFSYAWKYTMANEQASTFCKFHLHSIMHQEVMIPLLFKIIVSSYITLCVEAEFCQI